MNVFFVNRQSYFFHIVLLMLNALTDSHFWVYLLLPVFAMDKYADFILSVVTQRFYLLSQLKNQGVSMFLIFYFMH